MSQHKPMNRLRRICCLMVAVLVLAGPVSVSEACPMCKTATETAGNERQPAAYMASILTMLGMPTVLFGVLGVALYRVSRQEQKIAEELAAEPETTGE